ncbi:MAG: histidinol dehydrogenase [Candidatus Egerieousia sp.]
MEIFVNPRRDEWKALTERNIPDDKSIEESVGKIIERVRNGGDAALRSIALEFDKNHTEALEVSAAEIAEACAKVNEPLRRAVAVSAANIERFHKAQMPSAVDIETMPGVRCVQRPVPIRRVGLYIPGGRAPLFSTVLMLAIPAKIAGCEEVILCTPQSNDNPISPEILYAATYCGINKIYRIGGAQAIAAMAYGTESVPKVDKIFGPGNRYVMKAKQMVSRNVAIDMPAGPSEVLVMADETARAEFVAADMLSQAEHGPDSQAVCVCSDKALAEKIMEETESLRRRLSRSESIGQSLKHSRIVVFGNRDEMIDFVNEYGPEHLIISMAEPWTVAEKITAAGSVFIGNYSPESAGDYASGTNHTLPTNGWAHSCSGVNIDSFMKKMTLQELKPQGLKTLSETIVTMAEAEGLDAHALAVKIRMGL